MTPMPAVAPTLPDDLREDPRYYLRHFQFVLDWVAAHHDSLLAESEWKFIVGFGELPEVSQALLVRMVSRKGELFRLSRLDYAEIGDSDRALVPLVEAGMVIRDPLIGLDELFAQLRVPELRQCFAERLAAHGIAKSATRQRLLDVIQEYEEAGDAEPQRRRLSHWWTETTDQLVQLTVMPVCDRLRLMFFGNLHQTWSDFVLAELGLVRYQQVDLGELSHAFQCRGDVDLYLALHDLRGRLDEGESIEALLTEIPPPAQDNPWLAERRARLLYRLGQQAQRDGDIPLALHCYGLAGPGEARIRRLRLLERQGEYAEAHRLALEAQASPCGEAEQQGLERLLPRLARKLELPRPELPPTRQPRARVLELPADHLVICGSVELAVRDAISHSDRPAWYVENGLITGLFGLLCWEVVFAPLPGAFFHPFQHGPADLRRDDFVARRRRLFDTALARLDDGSYRDVILDHRQRCAGLANPFVHWELLEPELLSLALDCIPAMDLRCMFQRLLLDPAVNRSGLPDLVQFLPGERPSYRLIEVKAPGDRLQDNQRRWLDWLGRHHISVEVWHVEWRHD
ncbi:VRR-NUC domain-containing protein [Halomonas cupida]|uniref:phosphodiesterase I n=2 Tax=Halomonas cupida TaxID=44933 RepID=A0A1M7J101_9GAMM|nr:VRR-NUC domain-containing protein [Halomonas cupida]